MLEDWLNVHNLYIHQTTNAKEIMYTVQREIYLHLSFLEGLTIGVIQYHQV